MNLFPKSPSILQSISEFDEWPKNVTSIQDFNAHLAETVITASKTINVPGDFATIQAALDSLKKAWIPRDVTVTIQVAAGTFNHYSPVIVDHPCGSQIKIIGATPVITTITGVGTISGAAGNWNVPLIVQSTSGISAGDYVIVRGTSGTDDHYSLWGIWEVVSIDSPTQLTVKNSHRKSDFPSHAVTSGTLIALKTILKFTNSHGIIVSKDLGLIDNVAIVGDKSYRYGLIIGSLYDPDYPDNVIPTKASAVLGNNFGTNGFGRSGILIGFGSSVFSKGGAASCNNEDHGWDVCENAYLCTGWVYGIYGIGNGNNNCGFGVGYNAVVNSSGGIIACGNGADGAKADTGSFIDCSGGKLYNNLGSGLVAQFGGVMQGKEATAVGNGACGFNALANGAIWAPTSYAAYNNIGYGADRTSTIQAENSTANNNVQHGFWTIRSSIIYALNCTSTDNGVSDFYADIGGVIDARNSTAGNYTADKHSYIEASGYIGSPTFTPSKDTLSRRASLITTSSRFDINAYTITSTDLSKVQPVYRSDYGGNFATFTPPTAEQGKFFFAEDTNTDGPAKRLYTCLDESTWSYVNLT